MHACDRCHIRKTRCDRRIPRCTACEKAGAPCLHVDKLRKRNIPRAYLDNVENQLERLYDENQRLREELTSLRNAVQDPNCTSSLSDDSSTAKTGVSQLHESGSAMPEISHLRPSPKDDVPSISKEVSVVNILSNMVDPQSGNPILASDLQRHSTRRQNVVSAELSCDLPSKCDASRAIEAYFEQTHNLFPLIHRPTFLHSVENMYSHQSYYEDHPNNAFVFDMVLSIGSSIVAGPEEMNSMASTHYTRACERLPVVMSLEGIFPLQAILFLAQYGIFNSLQTTSASIWHLVGVGVRLCVEMGLHLETKGSSASATARDELSKVISFEKEMKRRCFWCLYNLDRVVSFTLGRSTALKDNEITVSFPSHLDDDQFGPDLPIHEISGPESNINRKQSPFLQLIQIRRLSGRILETFYTSKQSEDFTEKKHAIRNRFHGELVSWREDMESLCVGYEQSTSTESKAFFYTPAWYNALFGNAMLLLYRPSPHFPQLQTACGVDGDLNTLFVSAKTSIDAYDHLNKIQKLNLSWIAYHSVLIAGLAYIYCINRMLKEPSGLEGIANYHEIIHDTRVCSRILSIICERSGVGHGSYELFQKMSDAITEDAKIAGGRSSSTNGEYPINHSTDLPPPDSSIKPNHDAFQLTGSHFGYPSPASSAQSLVFERHSFESPLNNVFIADDLGLQFDGSVGVIGSSYGLPYELAGHFAQNWPLGDVCIDVPNVSCYDINIASS